MVEWVNQHYYTNREVYVLLENPPIFVFQKNCYRQHIISILNFKAVRTGQSDSVIFTKLSSVAAIICYLMDQTACMVP